jgi:acyl-coenzyme A thioesterase PaaI-like protein
MTGFDPTSAGWIPMNDNLMPAGLGAPWRKRQADRFLYGLLTGANHADPAGAVHGGILVAFVDHHWVVTSRRRRAVRRTSRSS